MIKDFLEIELNPKRIYGLDILRAVAIFYVVFDHSRLFLPNWINRALEVIMFDGVSLFFVLSGFLIGGILINLIETRPVSKELLVNFWIRRWFRTLPTYFLILIVLIIINLLLTDGFSALNTWKYFVFSQNLFVKHPSFFPEAWSLSIEEWFYLIIPLSIFMLIRFLKISPKNSILFSAVFILISITVVRFYRFSTLDIPSLGHWNVFFRMQIITRLDSIMFGVIGAYLYFYKKEIWLRYKSGLLVIGILLFAGSKALYEFNLVSVGGFYNCVCSFSVISLATLLLLPYLSTLKNGKGPLFRNLTKLSLVSYSMYLINLTIVQQLIVNRIPWDDLSGNSYLIGGFRYGLFWFITIIGSILLYKYYELPTMKLRDHPRVKKAIAWAFNRK